MRPNLSAQKNEPIKGTINGTNEPINAPNDTINDTINAPNGTINGTNDPINGTNDPINGQNDPINDQNDPINGHNDPINDPINILSEVEKEVLRIVKENPGLGRINIAPILHKSEVTVKRALRTLVKNGLIEYRGSKKTGGYFTR